MSHMADEPTKPKHAKPDPEPDEAEVTAAALPVPDTGYTDAGVPTLEGVREKIESRYGTALGATELASETPEARTAEERYEANRKAAAEKLEEIRKSMGKPQS